MQWVESQSDEVIAVGEWAKHTIWFPHNKCCSELLATWSPLSPTVPAWTQHTHNQHTTHALNLLASCLESVQSQLREKCLYGPFGLLHSVSSWLNLRNANRDIVRVCVWTALIEHVLKYKINVWTSLNLTISNLNDKEYRLKQIMQKKTPNSMTWLQTKTRCFNFYCALKIVNHEWRIMPIWFCKLALLKQSSTRSCFTLASSVHVCLWMRIRKYALIQRELTANKRPFLLVQIEAW